MNKRTENNVQSWKICMRGMKGNRFSYGEVNFYKILIIIEKYKLKSIQI